MAARPLFTNKHDLPEEVVKAIMKDRYTDNSEEQFDFSASTLCNPTQKIILERRHKGRLRIFDVVDRFWAFLGSIAHTVLEEAWHESMGSISERRLYMMRLGFSIAGKMDIYHEAKRQIRDYKLTKVYKVQKKDFYDWEVQLNIYAHLCRENNMPVDELKIIVMLSDWKKGEAKYKQDYPQSPIIVIPLRLWSHEEAEGFIWAKVEEIVAASALTDDELAKQYPCTDRDRWADIQGYALMRQGAQKATKRFDTREEANEFIKDWPQKKRDEYYIEERKSEPTRCIDWCEASTVCHQWRKEKGEPIIGESETEKAIF